MPSLAEVRFQLGKIQKVLNQTTPASSQTLEAIRQDPAKTLTLAGMKPDTWQTTLLRSSAPKVLVLASRQVGKSTAAASLAVNAVLAGGLVLLLSPSQRQSIELFRKVVETMSALFWPIPALLESLTRLELVNGGRVISLPGNEATTRCFSSVNLLVVDEAARVPDSLYGAVRPMLAVSGGWLVALSTPWAKEGWFYESWTAGSDWERFQVKATECQRIPADFLELERADLGERVFEREYGCKFMDAEGGLFSAEDVQRALQGDVQPLFGQ